MVLGANGQLGQSYQYLSKEFTWAEFYFFDRNSVDVSHVQSIKVAIDKVKPHFIINCAAYTAVDKAENDENACYKGNTESCKALVEAMHRKEDIRLMHFSTDYVYGQFDGFSLHENISPNPVNIYAKSKWEGEKILRNSTVSTMIIRTSWVISPFGNNFVKTMVKLGSERESLNVVNDQYGAPTFTFDLVRDTMQIIEKSFTKRVKDEYWNDTYNYANEGIVTWYDIAKQIMLIKGLPCHVLPIPSNHYPTPAKRPHWSVLSKKKLADHYNVKPPHWYDALLRCIRALE
jgi:dTDP-4-dehydrorhamnose reductase